MKPNTKVFRQWPPFAPSGNAKGFVQHEPFGNLSGWEEAQFERRSLGAAELFRSIILNQLIVEHFCAFSDLLEGLVIARYQAPVEELFILWGQLAKDVSPEFSFEQAAFFVMCLHFKLVPGLHLRMRYFPESFQVVSASCRRGRTFGAGVGFDDTRFAAH